MNEGQSPKQIGLGMWVIAWILLFVVLFMFFKDRINDIYNPNQDLQRTPNSEVVLKRNHDGHYVANGSINGFPVVFLLDTGATTISIPNNVARKIGLKKGVSYKADTANGMINVYSCRLDSVQLGGIELNNIQGHINPRMEGDTVLLGMSFMRQLEMTQKGNTLTLRY